jgi:hypothetical protein
MNESQPKNFAFIRVRPIKQWGKGNLTKSRKTWGLAGNVAHDLRFINAPNADSERIAFNMIICAKTDWKPMSATKENLKKIGITNSNFLSDMAIGMIAGKGVVVQKNHVKAAMLMAAVSPEYLRDGDLANKPNREKVQKLVKGTTTYLKKKYGDRLLMLVFHGDEQNPHISAYVVPLIEKTIKKPGRPGKDTEDEPRETRVEWRLAFTDFFRRDKRIVKDGKFAGFERGPCTLLQDEYAAALREHGLDVQRGIRKADEQRALPYETTQTRYDRLRAPVAEIEAMSDEELREWAMKNAHLIREAKRSRQERDHYQKTSGHHQQRADQLEKRLAQIQREIPVVEVIRKLTGLEPHEAGFGFASGEDGPTPPMKKRTDIEAEFLLPNGLRIGITGNNGFENLAPMIRFPGEHANRTKARGAISAVKFLTNWNHAKATQWLADTFGDEPASLEAARDFREEIAVDRADPDRINRKNLASEMMQALETPDDSRWPEARKKLTETLRFRTETIEQLRNDKMISANEHGHIVFEKQLVSGTEFKPAGKIVVHPDHPSVNLSDAGDGLFMLPGVNDNLIICATPTDALAIKSLPAHHKDTVVVIGNNPTESTAASLRKLVENSRGIKRFAKNLTMVGQRLAVWLKLHFSDLVKLHLPDGCSDWLEAHRLHAQEKAPAKPAIAPPKTEQETPNQGDSPN